MFIIKVDLKNQWLSFLDYTSTTTVESVCPHLRSSYNPVASAVSVVYLCLHTQDLLLSGTIYTCGIITTVKKCLSVWIRKRGGLSVSVGGLADILKMASVIQCL